MKSSLFFLAFILLNSIEGHSQVVDWQKCFGGSNDDNGAIVALTSDNGYIVAGNTWSQDGDVSNYHGWGDILVIKLNSSGNIIWKKTLGGSLYESPTSIKQTTDNGFILCAVSESNDGDVSGNHGNFSGVRDYWIVKLDSVGTISWQKPLGGTGDDIPNSIIQTIDGGFIVAGNSDSNDGDITTTHTDFACWVVKLDLNGNIVWQNLYVNGSGSRAIVQTNDTGYLILGNSGANFYALKIDSTGSSIWEKYYGGSGLEQAMSLVKTLDGGFLFVGDADSNDGDVFGNHGGQDFWVVKVDSLGNIIWQKCYGGTNGDNAFSAIQTIDGGYSIAGITSSIDGDITNNHGMYDYWIIKINNNGILEREKSFGGSNTDWSNSILETIDGGFIVAGETESTDGDVIGNHGDRDFWVLKLNTCVAHYSTLYDSIQNSFTLTVHSTTTALATGYNWDFGDGASSTLAAPSHTYTADTVYNVCMKIYLNSGDSCIYCHILGKDSLGNIIRNPGFAINVINSNNSADITQNSSDKTNMKVFPNPTSGIFTIISKENEYKLIIINVLGEHVYQSEIKNPKAEIDLSKYPAGIYFINIKTEKGAAVQKLIINK